MLFKLEFRWTLTISMDGDLTFSIVLVSSTVICDFFDVCFNHEWSKHWSAVIRVLGKPNQSLLYFNCSKIEWKQALLYRPTYSRSFSKSFAIKSSASFDTLENASSSKSYLPIVTFVIVSTSVEPINGDKPDSLQSSMISLLFGLHSNAIYSWINHHKSEKKKTNRKKLTKHSKSHQRSTYRSQMKFDQS